MTFFPINNSTQSGETNAARDNHNHHTVVGDMLGISNPARVTGDATKTFNTPVGVPPTLSGTTGARPLPRGWEERTTHGKVYYVDHNKRSTTWIRPSPDPLPTGWEARLTPDGRTFFVDHNTKSTTWIRPSPNPTTARAGSLAAAWKERLSFDKLMRGRHK